MNTVTQNRRMDTMFVLMTVLALLFTGANSNSLLAQLSVIRQGPESAGALKSNSRMGHSVAAGDFNGDGIDDLATGVPNDKVSNLTDAGSVVINKGSQFGLTYVGAKLITASNLGETSTAGAQFGYSLVAADFNHDGYCDLAIGAPYETVNGFANAGRVYLVYGSASGLNSTTVTLSEETGGAGTVAANDNFGYALASGNFDGDAVPYMDLAVGAPGVASGAGAVYVNYLGSFLGITTGIATQFKQSTLGFSNQSGDNFGKVLAAGDFFGTAQADLAVGVPYKDVLGIGNAGVVYLIAGSNNALTSSGAKQYDDVVRGIQQNGYFGAALAAGQILGNSYTDLAIGEPGHYVGAQSNAGVVILATGGALGLTFTSGNFLRPSKFGTGPDNFGSSIAIGKMYDPDTNSVIVGSPNQSSGMGKVDVFNYFAGYDTITALSFSQQFSGERAFQNDHYGYALCMGKFDAGIRQTLVVGVPDKSTSNDISYDANVNDVLEFTDAGEVINVAVYRQPNSLGCHNAIVTDCNNDLVFAFRPFDRVRIASITKIMTILLACEHVQAPLGDPKHIDSNTVYTTPKWVSDSIPGSQVNLAQGEKMSLIDMMFSCLMVSGNDAAHAIGDLLYGSTGPAGSLSTFVQEMNDRAASLGMTGTHFHNPAGLDGQPVGPPHGGHYSTPTDYIKLARYAMQNPLFARIAGTKTRQITRHYSNGDVPWTCQNIFSGIISLPNVIGIKGGSTTKAQASGCFAGKNPALPGMAIACTFGTPNQEAGNAYVNDCSSLINIGLASCAPAPVKPGIVYDPPFNFILGGVPTSDGVRTSGGGGDRHSGGRQLKFELKPQKGDPVPRFKFELKHNVDLAVDLRDTIAIGVAPFQSHNGFRLVNMNDSVIDISVQTSDNRTQVRYVLPYQGQITLPPYTSPTLLASFLITLKNNSPYPVEVGVTEDYLFNFDNTYGPLFSPSLITGSPMAGAAGKANPDGVQSAQTSGTGSGIVSDNFLVDFTGEDSTAGNQILLGAHPADESIDGTYLNTVESGWNMISLPLLVDDGSMSHLYPTSASQAFSFAGGYKAQDTIMNGRGYWLKFDTTGYLTVDGVPLAAETIAVADKWNLIGSLGSPVPVSAIGEEPSGIVSSSFYGYNGGYFVADTIQPGKAYWVKVAGGGALALDASAAAPKSSGNGVPDYSKFNSLTIEHTASGGRQVLYFGSRGLAGDAAAVKRNFEQSELPPTPPQGIFDARFASGRMLELIEPAKPSRYTVSLTSANGPLAITWTINEPSISTRLSVGGHDLLLTGTGTARIANHGSELTLAFSSNAHLPQKFALGQNYPNPFNPSTNITFDLPEPAAITLRIFNVLGQEVATAINNQQYDAGHWARQFNEPRLSSGVYFYRFEARTVTGGSPVYIEQKKMILLK